MTNNSNKFKFFIPLNISKGNTANGGKQSMIVDGIASTNQQDSDGEFLDPNGFDLSYFLKSGYVNWHHQATKDPSMIIGEPIEAKITKDGMYVKAELYDNSSVARSVFELAETLKKSGSSRQLGFSIEGQSLEKDILNPKKILKARITGLAITPSPKNPGTLLNVIKGELIDEEIFEDFDIVDENKSFHYKDGILTISKSDTVSSEPLILESVDNADRHESAQKTKKKKKRTQATLQTMLEEPNFIALKEHETITKGLFFKSFIDLNCDTEEIEQFYKLTKAMSTDVNNISKADIQKALGFLELIKSMDTATQPIETVPQSPQSQPVVVDQKLISTEPTDIVKSMYDRLNDRLDILTELIEGIGSRQMDNDQTRSLGILQKATLDQLNQSSEGTNNLLSKALSGLSALSEEVLELKEQLEQVPVGRKSITPTQFIQKGFGSENNDLTKAGQNQIVSLSNRKATSDLLLSLSGLEKGGEVDREFVNAVQLFEAAGSLPASTIQALFKKGYTVTA